jgi:dihydrofolate reductase
VSRLIYSAITSLDGYVADESGDFSWAAPDPEVHAAVNDLVRPIETFLLGRRMYEVMVFWETVESGGPAHIDDFAAIWRGAEKVVYSRSLGEVSSARTRIERAFDPEAVRRMKAGGDLGVGGPGLAAVALDAGLVDEIHLFVTPVVIGGGRPWFLDGVLTTLNLVDLRRFDNGTVHLGYRVAG